LGKLPDQVALYAGDYGIDHVVQAARFQHFKIRKIDAGNARCFQWEALELFAGAHIEDKQLMSTTQLAR
jgi:hypothetical protein